MHTHPYSVGRVRPAAGEAASRALDVRGDGVLGGAEETQGGPGGGGRINRVLEQNTA